jgi:hypothetical protein
MRGASVSNIDKHPSFTKEHAVNKNMKSLRSLALLLAVGVVPAFLSAQANSNSLTIRVAQLKGKINLVASDPSAPLADFTVASADAGAAGAKIAFKSTGTVVKNDEVDVIGDLTVALVEPDGTYNPSEDYAGPVYGQSAARTVTRQVVFALPKQELEQQKAEDEISATAVIDRENFPELLAALAAMNHPSIAKDDYCQVPANVGEDYAGQSCSGTAAEMRRPASVRASVGENHGAPEAMAPAGNQVKIVLNLRLPSGLAI